MSALTRRVRRAAARRTRETSMCFTVPAHGDLTAWEAAANASPILGPEERLLVGRIAHQVRRAMIMDGARPGDLVHIAYADLARVS